jgi:hypothetical protein
MKKTKTTKAITQASPTSMSRKSRPGSLIQEAKFPDQMIEQLIDELAEKLFPHQESEEEQETFTPEGRARVREWIERAAVQLFVLRQVASEFVAYYAGPERHPSSGCGHCGGLPHSSTCFVGRFQRALEAR